MTIYNNIPNCNSIGLRERPYDDTATIVNTDMSFDVEVDYLTINNSIQFSNNVPELKTIKCITYAKFYNVVGVILEHIQNVVTILYIDKNKMISCAIFNSRKVELNYYANNIILKIGIR